MKRLLLLFLFPIFAFSAPEITGAADVVSTYVFRGEKLTSGAIQPSVNVKWGPVYGNVWGSRAFQNDALKETDLTLGTGIGAFDTGVTVYTYPGQAQSTWEPYLGFADDLGAFKTSAYVFRDLALRTTTFEGKVNYSVVSNKRVEAGVEAVIGTTHGRDLPAYIYGALGPTVKFHLGRFGIAASLQYVSSSDASLKRNLLVSKIGVTF